MTERRGEARGSDAATERARDWVLRLASPDVTAEELRRFEAWLAAAPAHREAFETERLFWHRLDGLRAAAGPQSWAEEVPRSSPAAAAPGRPARRRRRAAVAGALAAAQALV
jgi:transmembrane sensor